MEVGVKPSQAVFLAENRSPRGKLAVACFAPRRPVKITTLLKLNCRPFRLPFYLRHYSWQ